MTYLINIFILFSRMGIYCTFIFLIFFTSCKTLFNNDLNSQCSVNLAYNTRLENANEGIYRLRSFELGKHYINLIVFSCNKLSNNQYVIHGYLRKSRVLSNNNISGVNIYLCTKQNKLSFKQSVKVATSDSNGTFVAQFPLTLKKKCYLLMVKDGLDPIVFQLNTSTRTS